MRSELHTPESQSSALLTQRGALRARLADLGFRDEDDAPDRGHLALGNLALRGDVCEEAVLMAYRPVQQVHEEL